MSKKAFSRFFHLIVIAFLNPCDALVARSGSNNGYTVAVVGGGVGGLATASRIASSPDLPLSAKVILVEKNSSEKKMIGGRCGSFYRNTEEGTFRHERGPSLLLLKDVYLELFSDCGRNAKEFGLDMVQCAPAYQAVFEDGESIMLGFPQGGDENVQAMEKKSREQMNSFETDGASKWDEYMTSTSAFLDCGLPNFIEERLDLASFPSFIIEALKGGLKAWPLKPHSKVLDATFESDEMRALASFQDLYVGLEPYSNDDQIGGGVIKKTAPAVFGLLAALELHPTNKKAGVFAPIGGFQSVANAFEQLAIECGVQVLYDTTVTSICAEGVWYSHSDGVKENEFLPADVVVCNADLPFATKTLIGSPKSSRPRYDWNDSFDYSSGVIAFHWSLDRRYDSLNTHNVFLMGSSREKVEKSWGAIRVNDPKAPSFDDYEYPFNFYVHRASAVDASAAPEGCDSIMVLVPCCTLKRDTSLSTLSREDSISGYKEQFGEALISRVRKTVLHRLEKLDGLQGMGEHIVDEVVDTPATYADDYNLAAGTPFALSHGFGQLSLTRPAHQSKDLDNVLFTGASTRPGNGVPLVLLGAKKVAKKAIDKLQNKNALNPQ